MKKILTALMCIPLWCLLTNNLDAQSNTTKGIHFETHLNWDQIKAKAKTENKFIFIDCYATWCGPCKIMDSEIYTNDTVGTYVNAHFISIKVQMDTSQNDNEEIQKWYADAKTIKNGNGVNAFPTFLFYSPSGRIVHRDLGAKKVADFVDIASNATNDKKQYYTLLERYEMGNRDFEVMQYLAETSKLIGARSLSDSISEDYIDNYLLVLPEKQLFTATNLTFIAQHIKRSGTKSFELFYSNGDKINLLLPWVKNYSQVLVDFIITKENIKPIVSMSPKDRSPDWLKIYKGIKVKYSKGYAERTVLNAKIDWYNKKDWPKYIGFVIEKMERYPMDTSSIMTDFFLNNASWYGVFRHSSNRKQIDAAITWMEGVNRRNPNSAAYLDTYSNLLYKRGRINEAIEIEKKVILLDPENKEYQTNLLKMQNKESTWVQ